MIGGIGAAVYRSDLADAMPGGVPTSISEAARDTLGGAVASAGTLPGALGAGLVDAARAAFTNGLQIAAACSATVAISCRPRRPPAAAILPKSGHVGDLGQPGGDNMLERRV